MFLGRFDERYVAVLVDGVTHEELDVFDVARGMEDLNIRGTNGPQFSIGSPRHTSMRIQINYGLCFPLLKFHFFSRIFKPFGYIPCLNFYGMNSKSLFQFFFPGLMNIF